MASICLLMFNLNENAGVIRNLALLESLVDEIVIVDSSDPGVGENLRDATAQYGAKIWRVPPLGISDFLVPYALSKVKSDYVLLLDSDEVPSSALIGKLRALNESEAYLVPRYEIGLDSYDWLVRFFKRVSVRPRASIHASFDVVGRTRRLDAKFHIIHYADYSRFYENKSRARRYFLLEAYCRPYTHFYMSQSSDLSESRILRSLLGSSNHLLPSPFVYLINFYEFATRAHNRVRLREAVFWARYRLAAYRYASRLPKQRLAEILTVSREIHQAGGLVRYLSLDDPAYVERLAAKHIWDSSGIDFLEGLLRYRHAHGVSATPSESRRP